MKCSLALRLLPLHAGGDLVGPRAADLELHLAGCEACAEEARSFQELRGVLSSVRQPASSAGLWEGLDTRLDAVDATRRLRRPWFRSPWLYTAAAAALLLALLPPWMPSGAGSEPALSVDPAQPALAGPVVTPGAAEDAEGLQRVPFEELDRFLRESAAFRQVGGEEGGLVASPVGSRSGEF